MADNRLSIGTHFSQQGREYVIEGSLPNGEIHIKDLITNEFTSKSETAFIDALFDGSLEILGHAQNLSFLRKHLEKSRVSDITLLEDDDPRKREAYRRKAYVQEVIKQGVTARTPQSLEPIIKVVAKRIDDPKPPSWSSANRWFKDYEASGRDERVLIPAWESRGNSTRKISGTCLKEYDERDVEKAEVVGKLIERVIRTKYLRCPAPTVVSVHKTLEARILEYNRRRNKKDHLPVPHVNTLYYYISKLDRYEVDLAHFGKSYADQKWRVNQQGPRPTRPLQRVQFDHTRIDLMVVDTKTRLPLGRPWLTTLMDVCTKEILGFFISFTKPSYASVMYCLLQAIRPKTYVGKIYPAIQNTWDAYGVPEMITVDNAKEFYCKSFKDACFQLGIEIHYAPRKAAWYKGSMERFYGTINTQMLHEMPGTTFSNIFEKKDYDPEKNAVISLDALIEMTHVYIIDIYHQEVHRGITDIPARKWAELIKDWPPNLPARKQDLEVLLGHVEERSIDSSGIEFYSLYYNNKELGLIRRQLKPREKGTIKIDINDISFIYVYDKREDRYLPVPALDQQYTKGLTLWQHFVIRNYQRKLPKLLVDRNGLAIARLRLEEIVEQEMKANKVVSGSEKLARFLNLGMPNYAELIEWEDDEDKSTSGEEEEPSAERAVSSHLAGISDPVKASLQQGGASGNGGDDSGQPEAAYVRIYNPDDDITVEAIAKEGKKGKTSRKNKDASQSSKKNVKDGDKTHSKILPVETEDDDIDENEWGSDYDLPV